MANPVSQSDLLAALDDLILEVDIPYLAPGDITVSVIKKRYGWNDYRAKDTIKRLVEKGYLVSIGERREPRRGGIVDAWRMVEK